MKPQTISNIVLLVLIFLISALFLSMISHFLMALLLAGIFSAMAQPVYRRITGLFGGRHRAASLVTLLLFCLMVLVPVSALVSIITPDGR